MLRRVFVASVVVLAFVAATSSASSTTISPCRQVSNPTWSPDGTQIAYYGTRWPPPAKAHRTPNDILQAALHRKRRRDERATSPLHGLQREVLRSPEPDRLGPVGQARLPRRRRLLRD